VGVSGEGADEGGDGAGDEGGIGGLSVVFLPFVGQDFVEGLGFKNGSPCGVVKVSWVIWDEDAIETDMFLAFHPDTEFAKCHGLAFCTSELAEGGGFVNLLGCG
jgi:hypothetical protein